MALQVWLPMTNNTLNYGLSGDLKFSYINEATNINGKLGKCYRGQWLYHSETDILSGNRWTIACWMKADSFGIYNDILMCKNNDSSTECQYYMSIKNGTLFNLGINGGAELTQYSYVFSTGVWYHLAASYDGTNYKMYLNGEMIKSGTCSNIFVHCTNTGFGCRSENTNGTAHTGSNEKYFNDFRVYDNVLSSKEIKLISQGLVLHYPMNDYYNENCPNLITSNPTCNKVVTLTSSAWSYPLNCPKIYVAPGKPYLFSYDISVESQLPIQLFIDTNCNDESGHYAGNDAGQTVDYNMSPLTVSNSNWKTLYCITTPKSDNGKPYITHGCLVKSTSATIDNPVSVTVHIKNMRLVQTDHYSPYREYWDNCVYDTSGFGNNGSVLLNSAPLFYLNSPRYGSSSNLNGTAYIDFPFLTLEEFTISFWMKRNNNTETRQFMCTCWQGFSCELREDNNIVFSIHYGGQQVTINSGLKLTVADGWVLYTAALSKTDGCKLYINGVLKGTNTTANTTTYNITTAKIGKYNNNPIFDGCISDFRIYATALSASDIKSLYLTSASINSNGTLLLSGEVIEN